MLISSEYIPGVVSVIIPTYNRAHLIKETLESVLLQSYRPLEIIVIDDGSTDSTESVVSKIGIKNKDKDISLKYVLQKNKGAQVARNRGCQLSQGEFIQFLDDDDLLSKNKIHNQMTALKKQREPHVAYGSWRIYCNGIIKHGPLHQIQPEVNTDIILRGYLSSKWYCPTISYLFPREVVCSVGLFDENLLRRQDTDYLIRTLISGYQLLYVNDAVVYYRRHGGDHIGNRKNYNEHFSSTVRVIEKAHTLLEEQGRLDEYKNDIASYLHALYNEATYMGYYRGASIVNEKINHILMGDPRNINMTSPSSSKIAFKRYLKRVAIFIFGECGIDWLKWFVGIR